MPDWKTHIVFGLLVAIAWAAAFPALGIASSAKKTVSLVAVTAFASLFPDIDIRSSKMRGMVALLVAASVAVAYAFFFTVTWYYGIAYFCLLYFLVKYLPTRHRGITHTPLFALLFSVAAVIVYAGFRQAFALADAAVWFLVPLSSYVVHLAVDSL
ncbi:MAG: metal-dependent hydrolase [Candidatus Aenigmatarchaeota archaeon]